MPRKQVVLLNGPPKVGKDTAEQGLRQSIGHHDKVKFSDPVKKGTHASYELDVGVDHFEAVKDEEREEFLGLTPRQAYIKHSEQYMKPIHGADVFGKLAVRRMLKVPHDLIVVPDSGFYDEAMPAVHEFGADNVLLIRLYMIGRSFDEDSREYIDLPGVPTVDIENTYGNLDRFYTDIHDAVMGWLNQS